MCIEMKLTVALLLLATVSQAAEVKEASRRTQNVEESATNKRALAEGNASIGKRTSLFSTVAPSATPGIEYADSKELQLDKSPTQQIYATPVPQIAKISDVLTGQGPPFQTAIASHLYAPISVYQPRVASPTTFEVSAPVQSQLAYSENLSYQPNSVQYSPQVYKQPEKQALARLALQQPQQILVQPIYQQQAQLSPQQFYQQIPQPYQATLAFNQNQISYPQGFQVAYPQNQFAYAQSQLAYPQTQLVYPQNQVAYPKNPVVYPQNQVAYAQNHVSYPQNQVAYVQNQVAHPQNQAVYAQKLVQVPNVESGIVYAKQEPQRAQTQQPLQRELKTTQPIVVKPLEKQPAPEQNYNTPSKGAVSYASFSQSQPSPSFEQSRKQIQYQPQPQTYSTQPQYQIQPQTLQFKSESRNQAQTQSQPHTQAQSQYQVPVQPQYQVQIQPQYLVQSRPQYQVQSQPQFQIQAQPQFATAKLEPSPANSIATPVALSNLNSGAPTYYKHNPFQQQLLRPQLYSGQEVLLQNPEYGTVAVPPTFPPVQYFGKFAQNIFGGFQH